MSAVVWERVGYRCYACCGLVECYLSGQLLSNLLQLLSGCHRVSAPWRVEEYERHLRRAPQTLHLIYLTQVEVHHGGIGSEEPHRWSRWRHHIISPAAQRCDFSVIYSQMMLSRAFCTGETQSSQSRGRECLTSFVCNLLQVSFSPSSRK